MAETNTLTRAPARETNWLPAVAIGIGGVGLAAGLYLWLKKPPGIDRGDTVRARFTFDYLGSSGSYVLLVRFGYHRISGLFDWFDPEEGLDRFTLPINLSGPDSYEFDIDCKIPDGAKVATYDAEGSVLSLDMKPGLDWILRVFKDKAITVRKD